MARKKGETYTPEQKAKVVLELLKEEQTLGELETQYKVTRCNEKSVRLNYSFLL